MAPALHIKCLSLAPALQHTAEILHRLGRAAQAVGRASYAMGRAVGRAVQAGRAAQAVGRAVGPRVLQSGMETGRTVCPKLKPPDCLL